MPLCARCTGIYVGVLLAFCFLLLKRRMDAGRPFSKGQAMLTALMILPLVGVLAVASVLGEIFLWGSFVWLLLKNLCGRKRLPFWQISLAAAFLGLYAIGGLMQ